MEYLYAIFLGIVQGLTEFIPVSSSGHLVALHDFLNFNLYSDLAFDVALHTGTFLALLIFFWKDLIHYITKEHRMLWLILIGAVPAGLVGLFLEDIIDFYLRNPWIVALMLVIVGIIFLLVEKYAQQKYDLKNMTWRQALTVGLLQIISLIPGTSRSGITIVGGMISGMKRDQAARFSFLIGIPIFAGAALKKGYDLSKIEIGSDQWTLIAIGLITSFVVGFFCIKYLLLFLKKYPLNVFAYYRFALAAIIVLFLIFKP
ncbi:undecaprenyl-diphosphatase UppP [Patescibacteria group bacterium]|nr:undecaprenyl-diphosphatase UppP [Patescibacteria group bacterium]MBU1673405.1 undecaprenyl-diphosphatase UppP [Patescibacteria group bacterium]MBU1963309.1 undecaprenyl-diphosphatase UppP [Patescibacteria group bacterium]